EGRGWSFGSKISSGMERGYVVSGVSRDGWSWGRLHRGWRGLPVKSFESRACVLLGWLGVELGFGLVGAGGDALAVSFGKVFGRVSCGSFCFWRFQHRSALAELAGSGRIDAVGRGGVRWLVLDRERWSGGLGLQVDGGGGFRRCG